MHLIKVGAAVLNQTPFDWDNNQRNIVNAIEEARARGIKLLCLPELCVSGYGCEDDFFRPDLQRRAWESMLEIAAHTKGMAVTVGLPVLYNNGLFNCMALLVDGRLAGLAAKKNLAGDGIHYEPRWFEPWVDQVYVQAEIFGTEVPLGDIYFNIGGVKVGFEICEEAWVGQRPIGRLARRGVDVVFSPSASHFALGKYEIRKRLVLEGSRSFGGTYIYTNLLGNEAGRAIYDGGAMIAQSGVMLAAGPRLSFADYKLTYATVDLEVARMRQSRTNSFAPELVVDESDCIEVDFTFPKEEEITPTSPFIADSWEQSPHVKEEELARALALGLFDYLRKSYSRSYVVSLSGGADSTACSCLVSLMVEFGVRELSLNGFCRKLGYIKGLESCRSIKELVGQLLVCAYQRTRNSGEITRNAARAVAEGIGARFYDLDIDPVVEKYKEFAVAVLGRDLSWEKDDLALQNVQARVRSPGIWFIANLFGGILLSTSNRSEGAVGYCTMDGDTSGGLSPVAGVDKHFLRQWLVWLQEVGPSGGSPVPAVITVTQQAPTAELRPKEMSQTDEKDLMPYDFLEAVEDLAIEDNRSPLECFQLMRVNAGFAQYGSRQMADWIERFFRLWSINQWKRERLAPALHVDTRNLDPRTWRRSPILSGGFKKEIAEMKQYVGNLENAVKDAYQKTGNKTALIRVDIQNDFMPGGTLAVEDAQEILPVVNKLGESGIFDVEVDTQDYHPIGHCSFEEWPEHCVAGSKGAQFHVDLDRSRSKGTFQKGTRVERDSYSGFETGELAPFLRRSGVNEVTVVGLATDYCVKHTALDAVRQGFSTTVVLDACKGISLESTTAALDELKNAGVRVVHSTDILLSGPVVGQGKAGGGKKAKAATS